MAANAKLATPYPLGRLQKTDARDRKFLMVSPAIQRTPLPDIEMKTWRRGVILDQGQESSCVGHAWKGFLSCSPMRTTKGLTAPEIYHKAQEIDEFPGVDYDGTSVRAGAKVLVGQGNLTEYRWAFLLDDVLRWILTTGPVVVGTNWYASMFMPQRGDFLMPVGGALAGGHAYLVTGADRRNKVVRIVNSWGKGFGRGGVAFIRFADFERLLNEDGEACVAVEQKVPKATLSVRLLTVIQPFAQLIAGGWKHVETRAQPVRYRGEIGIYACSAFPKWQREMCSREPIAALLQEDFMTGSIPEEVAAAAHTLLPLGAVVALAHIHDCYKIQSSTDIDELERALGDWTPGRYAWVLSEVRPLTPPIPVPGIGGGLGLFDFDLPELEQPR